MHSFLNLSIWFLLCNSAWWTQICAKTVSHVFVISYIEGSPDGVFKNNILAINGKFPGPTIEADIGDTIQVDVVNLIQDKQNTSIHWHGLHMKGHPFEDGASQISQCPLRAGFIQRYSFKAQQTGSYWYHSHYKSQYSEGLWGVLIIHNKPEIYSYDGEILLTLSDWYHRSAHANEEWHLSPPSRGVMPYPDSAMMNGRGRYPCDIAAKQDRVCSAQSQTRPVFKTQRDKVYRIRVINTSSYVAFNFSIEHHKLKAIESDGTDVRFPVECDIASIAAAQRYSFLLKTSSSLNLTRFLIRAEVRKESMPVMKDLNINKYIEALMGDVTGILEYSEDIKSVVEETYEVHTYLDQVPKRNSDDLIELDEGKLTPYNNDSAPENFDKEVILMVGFFEDREDIRRGSFNRTPFQLPDHTPLLFSLIEGKQMPKTSFPIEVNYMDVVQVVVNNPFYGPHPFHLHGHHFWVMGSGSWFDGNYNPQRHSHTLRGDGVKRDTVVVQEHSWVVIRFLADNIGVHNFHCHIDWHNLSGMAATFIVGKELARRINITEEARKVCSYHSLPQDYVFNNSVQVPTTTPFYCIFILWLKWVLPSLVPALCA